MTGNKLIAAVILLFLLLPSMVFAGTTSNSGSSVGLIFESVIFALILICFFIALKIFSYLRGGEMASGWQAVAIGFVILCLAQLVNMGASLELFSLSSAIVLLIRMIGVVILLVGVTRIKKVLS